MAFQGLAGTGFTYFNRKMTPSAKMLHLGALKNDIYLVKKALDAGVSVDVSDEKHVTALLLACRYNNYDCAKFLLKKGAKPSLESEIGNTPLYTAVEGGFLSIVKVLFKYHKDLAIDDHKSFLLACQLNHLAIVQEFITCSADIEKWIIADSSAMHTAVQYGNTKIVTYLVVHGANVNIKRMDGASPLWVACHLGNVKMVQELLSLGADVYVTTNNDATPLSEAISKGFEEIVRLLLSNGAFLEE